MNITFGGYYGTGSLGDDIVLKLMINSLREEFPASNITVLASSPEKSSALYVTKCVQRYNLNAISDAFAASDLFILGGGSLIQDATSARSLVYYCELIKMAKRRGAKVYLMGGGIGPLTHTDYAADALRLCDRISVRDLPSKLALANMGINAYLSCDHIFTAVPPKRKARGRYFTVSVRKCASRNQINTDRLLDSIYPFTCEGLTPVFVSMQDECDLELCRSLAAQTGGFVTSPKDIDDLTELQSGAQFAVGMRLHFLLSAMLCSTPAVGLSYDPKIDALPITTFNAFAFKPYEVSAAVRSAEPFSPDPELRNKARGDILAAGELIFGGRRLKVLDSA